MLSAELILRLRKTLGIYGVDNRHDLVDLDPGQPEHERYRQAASGVAFIVGSKSLIEAADGYEIETVREGLRTSELDPGFLTQRRVIAAWGSAFLVTDRHVVTAGHCVAGGDVGRMAFVFGLTAELGWRDEDQATSPTYRMDPKQVAWGRSLVYCSTSHVRGDIAIVELAQPIHDAIARPLSIAPENELHALQRVGIIGYPRGLPCKAVVGAPKKPWPRLFTFDAVKICTSVDSFQINSGSPVLDTLARVIGVQTHDTYQGDTEGGNTTVSQEARGSAWATRIDTVRDIISALQP
jgi:hypothetical protein